MKRQAIHDGFCRCRICKPPLVGHARRDRIIGTLLGLLLGSAAGWAGVQVINWSVG